MVVVMVVVVFSNCKYSLDIDKFAGLFELEKSNSHYHLLLLPMAIHGDQLVEVKFVQLLAITSYRVSF